MPSRRGCGTSPRAAPAPSSSSARAPSSKRGRQCGAADRRAGAGQAERGQLGAARRAAAQQPPVPEHHQRDGRECQRASRATRTSPRRATSTAAACAGGRCGTARARGPRRWTTVNRSSPAERRSATRVACRSSAAAAQPLLEPGVVGVDEDHLTGLGVLDVDHPGGGELELAPVHHLDRHHVVPAGELAQRAPASPAR